MTQQVDQNFNRVQLKALLQWFTDIEAERAHFLVSAELCELPSAFLEKEDSFGNVLLNLYWKATRDMKFYDAGVEFKCRLSGVEYTLYVPYKSIIGYQTEGGFMMFNYMPTKEELEGNNDPEYFMDGNTMMKSEWSPSFQTLNIPEVKEELQKKTSEHLKLVHGSRTKKDLDRVSVDPSQQSYPFPEDRFAEYNAKRDATQQGDTVEEYRFKGTPQGIVFEARIRQPRVRPAWLTVIEGGKK